MDNVINQHLNKPQPMKPRDWVLDTLARIAAILGGYLAASLVVMIAPPVTFVAWLPMGFLLSATFGAMHRASHQALLPFPLANELIGRISATLLLGNYSFFRYSHYHHHTHIGTDEDTEPPLTLHRRSDYWKAMLTANALVHFTWPALRALFTGRPPEWIPKRARKSFFLDGLLQLAWIGSIATATLVDPATTATYYLCPLLVAYLFDAWFTIPEHYGCGTDAFIHDARSMTTARWIAFLQWEENFHREHHRFPNLPASECRRLGLDSRDPRPSYLSFHRQLLSGLSR